MYLEEGFRRHLVSYQGLIGAASDTAASNTADRIPNRPSMRFRAKLPVSCGKSAPINTLRFGEGGGPEARICANQVLAASVSSRHESVRKPARALASRVAAARMRKM